MNLERDENKIREKLSGFKNLGFDRIHLPGGTSKSGDYYSGVVPYHYDTETKEFYFLGLPYDSKYHESGDENGHTKKFGETPLATAVRELMEETALQVTEEKMEKLYSDSIRDRYILDKIFHRHYFFCSIDENNGGVFTFEGRNPIDGETGAPIWIPAKMIKKTFFHGHYKAIKKTINFLMSQNNEYAFALMNIF